MTTPNLALETWPANSQSPSIPINDSLQTIDALARPGGIVQDKDLTTPPTTVAGDAGKRWIIPSGATGVWSGKTDQIALSVGADLWRYYAPSEGWRAYLLDENTEYRHNGTTWVAVADGVSSVNGQSGAVVLDAEDLREPVTALSIASGVVNIDCALGNYFTLSLTANVTSITFTNIPAAGFAKSIAVRIRQDGTGSRTVALPASFKATGGSDTAVQSAANAYTLLTLATFDQGTRWEYAMQEIAA